MAVFFHLLNMDLVSTTVHKIVIILLYSIPALLVFAIAGDVDWVLGLSLAAGNATGAFAAAKIAVRRGEKAIRCCAYRCCIDYGSENTGVYSEGLSRYISTEVL